MISVPPRVAAILQWAITLIMPFFLIIASLYIFMSPQFVDWQYAQPDFPPAQLFTPEQRAYNAKETVAYVRGERTEQQLRDLKVYNAREIKHLVDVYHVSNTMLLIEPILLGVLAVALYFLLRGRGTSQYAGRGLFYGGIFTFVLVTLIGLFAVFAFDTFFVAFHRVFFEGDTWLFEYTDSLIQFYPELFWMKASYGIALFVLLSAVIITALGAWIMRRAKNA
jgi:integral membrane protein (TIGR01906 family)